MQGPHQDAQKSINNILPFRFGEFLKSYYLEKKEKISKYQVFGSLILERALDFLGLGFLFIILIPYQVLYKLNNAYLIIIISVLLTSLVIFSLSISFSISTTSLCHIYKSSTLRFYASDLFFLDP